MAIYRQLYTEFWNDDFMIELSAESKYFYIYLLTNRMTTQCGIFKFVKKLVSVETSLCTESIDNMLNEFVTSGRILYSPKTNEVMLLNWYKYNNTINHKNIRICINNELKRVKCQDFIKKFYDICATLCSTTSADDSILDEIFKTISIDVAPEIAMPVIREKTEVNCTVKETSKIVKDNDVSKVLSAFNENIHKASPIQETKLKFWIRTMDANVIIRAINEAASRDALSINYIVAILTNWKNEGVTTIESLDTFLSEEKSKKVNSKYEQKSIDPVPPYFTPFNFDD